MELWFAFLWFVVSFFSGVWAWMAYIIANRFNIITLILGTFCVLSVGAGANCIWKFV
jgi:nitrate reductase gamma subunit